MREPENSEKQSIVLTLDTGEREFRSSEEYESWISAEKEFFSWVESAAKKDTETAYVWNSISTWINHLVTFGRVWTQNNPAQTEKQKISIDQILSQAISQGKLITSSNPDAKFVNKIYSERGEIIGAYTLGNILKVGPTPNKPDAQFGAFITFQYHWGSEGTIDAHTEALTNLATDWSNKFKQTHNEIRNKNEIVENEIEKTKESTLRVEQEIASQQESQKEEFGKIVNESTETLEDIASTYDSKLALQSSVEYWRSKRNFHTKIMKWVGAATLGLAAITGCSFVFAAYKLLNVTAQDVELWRLGVILTISTFGIWMTRLSAKIFISNLHLRADADERVTMVQTYLALRREGAGPSDEERQLILQTLFRPSATGFIKDDGPSSFHDVATSVLSRK